MIHRSRRPATLPARRGMRAPWLRRRVPDDAAGPDGVATTGVAPAEVPGSAAPDPGPAEASPALAPVRPVHGHPTF